MVSDSDSVLEKLQQRVWNKFESGIPIKVKLLEVKTFSDSGDGFPEKNTFVGHFVTRKTFLQLRQLVYHTCRTSKELFLL